MNETDSLTGYHISGSDYSITSSYVEDNRPLIMYLSVASADLVTMPGFSKPVWYISRVKVHDLHQGRGIGSKLLKSLIEEIKAKNSSDFVIVTPGGYDGNTEKQFAFYKKNGFVDGPEDGLLIYPLT